MLNPLQLKRAKDLLDEASRNVTLTRLMKRLRGTNPQQAYDILSNLSDRERQVLAVWISKLSNEFAA